MLLLLNLNNLNWLSFVSIFFRIRVFITSKLSQLHICMYLDLACATSSLLFFKSNWTQKSARNYMTKMLWHWFCWWTLRSFLWNFKCMLLFDWNSSTGYLILISLCLIWLATKNNFISLDSILLRIRPISHHKVLLTITSIINIVIIVVVALHQISL